MVPTIPLFINIQLQDCMGRKGTQKADVRIGRCQNIPKTFENVMYSYENVFAGPLPLTVGHFWLVVWQQRSRAVLMLNRVFERGQPKCAQYWPAAQGETMTFEDVGLKVEHVRSVP